MQVNNDSKEDITNPKTRLALIKLICFETVLGSGRVSDGHIARKYMSRVNLSKLCYLKDPELLLQLLYEVGGQVYGPETKRLGIHLQQLGLFCLSCCEK